ncbi:hypothetical protein [Pseudonocardia parietis]|uniref:DUF892 family protein n=1 Tax=Pseudonocardia parietis TaxID=570936 RepID=A0ABS4VXP7_9PSEU|nr:hypothetical protein [Pseudonocardia parietis]MBP2368513.1 hypothetical protein [Pseudonocardia parietis]
MAGPADALSIYLNDHLGGANAGIELARQLEQRVAEDLGSTTLTGLAEAIEDDRDVLSSLIGRIGAGRHPVKEAAGWIAGQAQRIATAEILTGQKELSLLLHCEMLVLGITGKQAMWEAIVEIRSAYPALADIDLEQLVERARRQQAQVESVRIQIARRSFVSS